MGSSWTLSRLPIPGALCRCPSSNSKNGTDPEGSNEFRGGLSLDVSALRAYRHAKYHTGRESSVARSESPPRGKKDGVRSWWMPWPVVVLLVVTTANYVWQVPYYLHFYGRLGIGPGGLTVPLLLTFLWFLVAFVLLVTRRRGGVPAIASFLVVEALFYLVHNISGAAGHDLPAGDVVLLIASLLGYLNALASVLFLGWLFATPRRSPAGDRRTVDKL